jgi:hypothetical protein
MNFEALEMEHETLKTKHRVEKEQRVKWQDIVKARGTAVTRNGTDVDVKDLTGSQLTIL